MVCFGNFCLIVCLTHPLLYYVLLSSSSFIGAGLSVTPKGWTQCLPLMDPTNGHYRTTDNNYYGLRLPQLIMPCPPWELLLATAKHLPDSSFCLVFVLVRLLCFWSPFCVIIL